MSAKRFFVTFLASAVLCGGTAGAVTLDWEDLTNAQQKKAYLDLEEENKELKDQLARLEEQLRAAGIEPVSSGSSNNASGGGGSLSSGAADSSASSETGTVTFGSPGQLKSVNSFLDDLAQSFNARQNLARTYSTDEVSAMSADDMWNFRFQCAEAERDFFNSYDGAQFDDLNIFYLCSEYCLGLGKQFQAEEVWNSSGDSEKANQLYTAGYYNRAYALVELCEFYGLDLAQEYANLKSAVRQMDALSGEETRNASVDPATVMQVQQLLNDIGFRCGTPDGIAGRQTASSIERFQTMYGYEPADGIIDSELISQLQDRLARQQG